LRKRQEKFPAGRDNGGTSVTAKKEKKKSHAVNIIQEQDQFIETKSGKQQRAIRRERAKASNEQRHTPSKRNHFQC